MIHDKIFQNQKPKNKITTTIVGILLLFYFIFSFSFPIIPNTAYAKQIPSNKTVQQAENLPNILLGVFGRSETDRTLQLGVSVDGVNFNLVNSIFRDSTPTANPYASEKTLPQSTQGSRTDPDPYIGLANNVNRPYDLLTNWCPSIMYYNGNFWIITNVNFGENNRLQFNITYSPDLVHWQDPQWCYVDFPSNVALDRNLPGTTKFSAVASDFVLAPNNQPYIVVSVGTYGAYNGRPTQDEMYPYIVKVNQLVPKKDPIADPLTNSQEQNALTFSADIAKRINLPSNSNNYIDGSFFFDDDGTTYLSIKRDGMYPEVWTCGNYSVIDNSDNVTIWRKTSDAQYGNEAQSMAKINGVYLMYTDRIANTENAGQSGTVVQRGNPNGWGSSVPIVMNTPVGITSIIDRGDALNGPRHGTVITITDPAVKARIYNVYSIWWNLPDNSQAISVGNVGNANNGNGGNNGSSNPGTDGGNGYMPEQTPDVVIPNLDMANNPIDSIAGDNVGVPPITGDGIGNGDENNTNTNEVNANPENQNVANNINSNTANGNTNANANMNSNSNTTNNMNRNGSNGNNANRNSSSVVGQDTNDNGNVRNSNENNKNEHNSISPFLIVGIILIVGLVAAGGILFFIAMRKKKQKDEKDLENTLNVMYDNGENEPIYPQYYNQNYVDENGNQQNQEHYGNDYMTQYDDYDNDYDTDSIYYLDDDIIDDFEEDDFGEFQDENYYYQDEILPENSTK